jgi:hypothetical protein
MSGLGACGNIGKQESRMECGHSEKRSAEMISSGDHAMAALVDVMRDLGDVLRAENTSLRRGMPAALTSLTRRKIELSGEYADRAAAVLRHHAEDVAANHMLRNRLLHAIRELGALTEENACRLEAAMAATRRRIARAMAAIGRGDDAVLDRTADDA